MEFFSDHKHPPAAAMQMHALSVRDLVPYQLMAAPVFVFLKRNNKFIAIKSPLDFFNPQEIQRLTSYQNVYLPKTVSEVWRFQSVGRSLKTILDWGERDRKDRLGLKMGEVMLPPASYEVSDAVLKMVAPLWSKELRIESFFVYFCMEQICSPFSGEWLEGWRNQSVDRFEKGILLGSWMSFLLMTLGYQKSDFLTQVRVDFAERRMREESAEKKIYPQEIEELYGWLRNLLEETEFESLSLLSLAQGAIRATQKLTARVDRIQATLLKDAPPRISLRGLWGFLSA